VSILGRMGVKSYWAGTSFFLPFSIESIGLEKGRDKCRANGTSS
jgi:hypothetical protein